MKIRMYNVGFGECIKLQEGKNTLLIDCGSELPNKKTKNGIKRDEVFCKIAEDIGFFQPNGHLDAMISHFHNDHINGFYWLEQQRTHCFNRIFIPDVFSIKNHPNVVDILFLEEILRRFLFPNHPSVTLWDFLALLIQNSEDIALLSRGKNAFEFANNQFDVLWPTKTVDPIDWPIYTTKKQLDFFTMKQEFSELERNEIYKQSDAICHAVNNYISFDKTEQSVDGGIVQTLSSTNYLVDSLVETLSNKENNKEQYDLFDEKRDSQRRPKDKTPQKGYIYRQYYQMLKSKANQYSLVCQSNCSGKPVLFTGDIEANTLSIILWNKDHLVPLYTDFYAIKAPHHGTHSDKGKHGKHFFNFPAYGISSTYVLISNGCTTAPDQKRGEISECYVTELGSIILCTNTEQKRCDFWKKHKNPCVFHCLKCQSDPKGSADCTGCLDITI